MGNLFPCKMPEKEKEYNLYFLGYADTYQLNAIYSNDFSSITEDDFIVEVINPIEEELNSGDVGYLDTTVTNVSIEANYNMTKTYNSDTTVFSVEHPYNLTMRYTDGTKTVPKEIIGTTKIKVYFKYLGELTAKSNSIPDCPMDPYIPPSNADEPSIEPVSDPDKIVQLSDFTIRRMGGDPVAQAAEFNADPVVIGEDNIIFSMVGFGDSYTRNENSSLISFVGSPKKYYVGTTTAKGNAYSATYGIRIHVSQFLRKYKNADGTYTNISTNDTPGLLDGQSLNQLYGREYSMYDMSISLYSLGVQVNSYGPVKQYQFNEEDLSVLQDCCFWVLFTEEPLEPNEVLTNYADVNNYTTNFHTTESSLINWRDGKNRIHWFDFDKVMENDGNIDIYISDINMDLTHGCYISMGLYGRNRAF